MQTASQTRIAIATVVLVSLICIFSGARVSAQEGLCVGVRRASSISGPANGISVWKFYYFDLAANASSLVIDYGGAVGEVDMYVKFESQPTRHDYDCHPDPYVTTRCEFVDPPAGRWWIGIHTVGDGSTYGYNLGVRDDVQSPCVRPIAAFDWSMPDRFGHYVGGILQIPNTPAYANPSGFTVNFDAAGTQSGASPIVGYEWKIDGNGQTIHASGDKPTVHNLKQGTYEVSLTVTDANGQIDSITRQVRVKDLLIVSIGDSFASGEGNADRCMQFFDSGFPKAGPRWTDSVQGLCTDQFRSPCHRSGWAGSAQAALAIERADPRTSVTFVFLACTGASIEHGVLGCGRPLAREYKSCGTFIDICDSSLPPPCHCIGTIPYLPPQVLAVADIVGGREIDALIMSAGGNDIGFAKIVAECAMLSRCQNDPVVVNALNQAFATLPGKYEMLAGSLTNTLNLKSANIFITEYPDPTTKANDRYCDVEHCREPLFIGMFPSESQWASESIVRTLNEIIFDAAKSNSWNYVGGIAQDFRGHGWCAWNETFRPTGCVFEFGCRGTSYMVSSVESLYCQGPVSPTFNLYLDCVYSLPGLSHLYDGDGLVSSGTMHPNRLGHGVYRDRLLQNLLPHLGLGVGSANLAVSKIAAAGTTVAAENITYTITVSNAGPDDARDVVVTDELPPLTSFVSCSASGGGACGGSDNSRFVTFTQLPAGSSETIVLVARLKCEAPNGNSVVNQAIVTASSEDPDRSNNTASALTTARKKCPRPQGYWKSDPTIWPVASLVLGGKTYTKTELMNILKTPVGTGKKADASLILAHQLIATKINVASCSDPVPVETTIANADAHLGSYPGKLPYKVGPSTTMGSAMVNISSLLESYNKIQLTPDCLP